MREEYVFDTNSAEEQLVVLARDWEVPEGEHRLWRITNWHHYEINEARHMWGHTTEYRIATITMEEGWVIAEKSEGVS